MTKPVFYNLNEVAEILRVSDKTARVFLVKAKKKGLPAIKVGREWRIDKESLIGYLKGEKLNKTM